MHSDAGASARVRREHEEGRQAGDQVSSHTLTGVALHLHTLIVVHYAMVIHAASLVVAVFSQCVFTST